MARTTTTPLYFPPTFRATFPLKPSNLSLKFRPATSISLRSKLTILSFIITFTCKLFGDFSDGFLVVFAGICAFSSNDIKVGSNIEVDGVPWRVLEFLHVKPGKEAAFVRTKVRNYLTGNTVDKTFRAGSTIQEANIVKETKQFTYKEGSQFIFMDLSSYEETRLNEAEVGDKKKWLKEGTNCILLSWNGRVIDFELPVAVKLTVTDVDPGMKGDTAQGGSKPATLDTGAVVNVPLFVNIGDEIIVDTRTGQYTSRAEKS